jgi:DNA-binding transcriptional regulator GbsR (MarR family)
MEINEARKRFIQAWGTLGTSWGINKAMAQIHALLIVSPEPLSAEEIMDELQISRGNVNMNLRALMDWGIVSKQHQSGERKEFFTAGKDVWELARQVAKERKRRELDPILKVLDEIQHVSGDNKKDIAEFRKVTGDLFDFSKKMGNVLDKFSASDRNWFFKILMKL